MKPTPPRQEGKMSQDNNWKQFIGRMLSLGLQRRQFAVMGTGKYAAPLQQEAWVRRMLKEAAKNRQELDAPLQKSEFVVLDTETTGFRPDQGDEIISLAAVKIRNGELDPDVFATHVKPGKAIPQKIRELTGLADGDLAAAPALQEVIGDLLGFIGERIVVGYHVGHDIAFLNAFLWQKFRARMTQRVIEMRKVLETLYPATFPAFDDALAFFSIAGEQRHSALGDARLAARLWLRILQECELNGVLTLRDLYAKMSNR
ncbi:hypothetical protein BSNK01_07370 [Bacillaceae bacterium]